MSKQPEKPTLAEAAKAQQSDHVLVRMRPGSLRSVPPNSPMSEAERRSATEGVHISVRRRKPGEKPMFPPRMASAMAKKALRNLRAGKGKTSG